MDIESEKNAAKHNFKLLVKNIPCRLSKKEENIAEQIHKAKTGPIKKLETLYMFMKEIYEYASIYTPCKKGCSACCHYSVSISDVEIEYIEKKTKKRKKKLFSSAENFHGTPCPFLYDGCCSIYEARPFVCRRHVVLTSTNKWCERTLSNTETFPLLNFSEIDNAFHLIKMESLSFDSYDIRQVFSRNL